PLLTPDRSNRRFSKFPIPRPGVDELKGTEVSRKSVADLIGKLIDSPKRSIRANLGVNRPNTEGDKPAFFETDGRCRRWTRLHARLYICSAVRQRVVRRTWKSMLKWNYRVCRLLGSLYYFLSPTFRATHRPVETRPAAIALEFVPPNESLNFIVTAYFSIR